MNNAVALRRVTFPAALLLVCLLIPPAPNFAAEFQPLAICSFAGQQAVAADLEYLGSTVQNPSFPRALAKALAARTGVQSLAGLDPARPWGAVLLSDGLRIVPLAFVPVTDTAQLLASLEPLGLEPREAPEGGPQYWKIGQGTATGYVCQRNGWAFVAQTLDAFEPLPDPAELLVQMPAQCDFALRLYPTRLPEALRTMGLDMLSELSRSSARQPDETETEAAARRQIEALVAAWLERVLTEYQQVTLTWSLDREAKTAALELTIVPEPQSAFARSLSQCKPLDAALPLPDAAVSGRLAVGFDPPPSPESRLLVEAGKLGLLAAVDQAGWLSTASERQTLESTLSALVELWRPALENGRLEAGLALHGSSPPLALVAALRLGQADGLRPMLQRLAEQADRGGLAVRVRLDVARLDRLRVHSLEFPRLTELPEFRQLWGDDPTLYVAEAGELVLVALGHRALAALEKSQKPAADKAPPLRLSARLSAVASLASQQWQDHAAGPILSLLAANLRAGDDRVVLSAEADRHSLRLRLVAHEGVLRTAALGLSLAAIESLSAKSK